MSSGITLVSDEDEEDLVALVLALRESGNLHPLIAMLRNGEIGPERARTALYVLGEADLEFLVQVALDALIAGYLVDAGMAHQPNRAVRPDDATA